jgi:NAD(P)-dependent dehydrogenase (short-subunit alcohol dehydrogenase family)
MNNCPHRLILLQNNAGVYLDPQTPRPSVRELMASTYSVNVFGTATLTEAALPLLEKSAFPSIVNLSTTLGSMTHMSDKASPWYHAQALVRIEALRSSMVADG